MPRSASTRENAAVNPAASTVPGVDLFTDMAGIRSPNPFWLASCPISNNGEMVMRAFDAGWGGAVWKTIGDPIRNVTARLGTFDYGGKRLVGINNIELISDRPTDVNIAEIRDVKKRYPNHAVVISLMVEARREAWQQRQPKSPAGTHDSQLCSRWTHV